MTASEPHLFRFRNKNQTLHMCAKDEMHLISFFSFLFYFVG